MPINSTDLSTSFNIDVNAAWVRRHNEEARRVLEAYYADRPIRVPVLCDESFLQHGPYADQTGLDYRLYYTDPHEMLRVQLEAARLRREMPIYDFILGEAPVSWPVTVDLWPTPFPGWVGCELVYRKDAVIAHRSLHLAKEQCLALEMPDPIQGGILQTYRCFWEVLKSTYTGKLSFLGKPVSPFNHGIVNGSGFFSLALDIRGPEIMADMIEDPDFAHSFLQKMADWCDTIERIWNPLGESEVGAYTLTDHGIDMLSPKLYEKFVVPILFEMNRRRGTPPPSSIHHCGRGYHLFPVIKRYFGLNRIHALTHPIIDIARVRAEINPDAWIMAVIEDSIVQFESPEAIRQTVKDLMNSGAKGQGRLAIIVGDMLKGTPIDNRIALYESVKEFGGYV